MKESIDIIYLWCDGGDPIFQSQKNATMAKLGIPFNEELVGEKRFSNHDELKYSLRSVHDYIPWVNHIYIVTNNQIPVWLKSHPKITIVDHKEIIPSEFLPTFSAFTIETYIANIKGLSEKFLYFNDDMFINRTLSPNDFFENNKPIIWVKNFKKEFKIKEFDRLLHNEKHPWRKSILRSWGFFCTRNKLEVPYMNPNHNVDAFTKTEYIDILEKYPELVTANSSNFRTGNEISRHIFAYEMIYLHDCKVLKRENETALGRALCLLGLKRTTAVGGKTLKKLIKNINRYRPNTFCMNEINKGEEELFMTFMQEKFPNKAPWEK